VLRRVVSLLTVLGIVLAFGAFEVYGHPFSSPEQRRSLGQVSINRCQAYWPVQVNCLFSTILATA